MQVLKNDEVVKANSENKYVIRYEFRETNTNQNVDQNKLFKANVKVSVK